MFEIFLEEKVVTVFLLFFWGMSVLLQVLLGLLYQNMIRETENMSATQNKLLKQCKLKFANCFQMNNGVSNIPVFVDRFLNRLALGPVSFEAMYHFSGQSMLLSVVSAGVGICRSILDGKRLGEILPFYIVCFLELYLYFSISAMVDVKGKRRILKVNLVDFLENHLSPRIHATAEEVDMLRSGRDGGRNLRIAGRNRRNGRRTVELMPIEGGAFNRLSQREDAVDMAGEKVSGDPLPEEGIADALAERATSLMEEEELEALLKEFFAM